MCQDSLLAQSLEECQHHLHGGFTDKASCNSRFEPESWRTPRIRTGKRAALQRPFGWWEQNEQNPRVRNPQWELCRAQWGWHRQEMSGEKAAVTHALQSCGQPAEVSLDCHLQSRDSVGWGHRDTVGTEPLQSEVSRRADSDTGFGVQVFTRQCGGDEHLDGKWHKQEAQREVSWLSCELWSWNAQEARKSVLCWVLILQLQAAIACGPCQGQVWPGSSRPNSEAADRLTTCRCPGAGMNCSLKEDVGGYSYKFHEIIQWSGSRSVDPEPARSQLRPCYTSKRMAPPKTWRNKLGQQAHVGTCFCSHKAVGYKQKFPNNWQNGYLKGEEVNQWVPKEESHFPKLCVARLLIYMSTLLELIK